MSSTWWAQGQIYTAPDRSDVIVRIASRLYIKVKGQQSFTPMPVTNNESVHQPRTIGILHFNRPNGRAGTLTVDGDNCLICYNTGSPIAYRAAPLTRTIRRRLPLALTA